MVWYIVGGRHVIKFKADFPTSHSKSTVVGSLSGGNTRTCWGFLCCLCLTQEAYYLGKEARVYQNTFAQREVMAKMWGAGLFHMGSLSIAWSTSSMLMLTLSMEHPQASLAMWLIHCCQSCHPSFLTMCKISCTDSSLPCSLVRESNIEGVSIIDQVLVI